MTNPFEADGNYLALVNEEGQYSLWPRNIAVPEGWNSVYEGDRAGALEFIETNWSDMRPLSLVRAMES